MKYCSNRSIQVLVGAFCALTIVSCGGDSSVRFDSGGGTVVINDDPSNNALTVARAFPDLVLENPVAAHQPPNEPTLWLAALQDGRIVAFDDDQTVSQTSVVLDIRDRTECCGERGLLGFAFHPDHPNNGRLFVSYTRPGPESVVAEFVRNPDGTIDPDSESVVLSVAQPQNNHNGGHLAFGPDGFLYIGFGDGGGANDPGDNAQNTRNVLGAMVRIDVDSGTPYSIPSGNPFAGNALCSTGFGSNDCPEIFAWGFRNPWRWNFDPVSNDLWLADVGQDNWEEVNRVVTGTNYGWRDREGAHCNEAISATCSNPDFVDPVVEYDHSLGQSVTGGYVYRGADAPDLVGTFVFGDFISGRIWNAVPDGSGFRLNELLTSDISIGTFATATDGTLYVIDYREGTFHRIFED